MTAAVEPAGDAVAEALVLLHRGVDDLLAGCGGLAGRPAEDVVAIAREVERFRNRLLGVDAELVAAAERAGAPVRFGQKSLIGLWAAVLRIAPAEAARRVRAGEALTGRVSMVGQPRPPLRPTVAAAVTAGELGTEQVDTMLRT